MLQLPLWTVTEHIHISEPDQQVPCDQPGTVLAFTTAAKMLAFMSNNVGGEWKMAMAQDRAGLIILIADFHRAGVQGLCLDPEQDGSGGKQVPLTELMALAESLKAEYR